MTDPDMPQKNADIAARIEEKIDIIAGGVMALQRERDDLKMENVLLKHENRKMRTVLDNIRDGTTTLFP